MLLLKDVLDLVHNRVLLGGGKSSNQTSTLQTITHVKDGGYIVQAFTHGYNFLTTDVLGSNPGYEQF